jgi:hypothetical protein
VVFRQWYSRQSVPPFFNPPYPSELCIGNQGINLKTDVMKPNIFHTAFRFALLLFFAVINLTVTGQATSVAPVMVSDTLKWIDTARINFYILTMDFKHKVDVFGFTVKLRADIRSLFSHKKLVVIKAKSAEQVAQKMESILAKEKVMIGTIWFDSHGFYRSCVSSVNIGSDAFSYRNINDSASTAALRRMARYCDAKTSIGIGSCYGGATFTKPATDSTFATNMNGDSLMIGFGKIFYGSTIYGSESWVMVKPGMFGNRYGLAGYPLGKRYLDDSWKPVWERLGEWNRYNAQSAEFGPVNTIGLSSSGSITIRPHTYKELTKGKNAVKRNLVKL